MLQSNLRDISILQTKNEGFSVSREYLSLLEKYNINFVRVYQNEIVGPAAGMIRLIEETYKSCRPQKVADIFAGSLGYSQVCSRLGAAKIDAYDLQIKNYYSENTKLQILEKDLLTISGSTFSNYDLIIAEPPRKYHLLFLNSLPQFLNKSMLLFRIGSIDYSEHLSDCRKICAAKFSTKKWSMVNLYREAYIKMED